MGCPETSAMREVYNNMSLPQETRKTSNKQPTLHLKQLENRRKKKNPKVSRRKEIMKIRVEKIEKEMKETIAKISKTKI